MTKSLTIDTLLRIGAVVLPALTGIAALRAPADGAVDRAPPMTVAIATAAVAAPRTPTVATTTAAAAMLATPGAVTAAERVTATDAAVEDALRALAPRVARTSDSDALRVAFAAYFNYRAAHPDAVRKPYFYFVDLGLNNSTPRGYVFDMERLAIVDGPFPVAHGRGSGPRNGVPTKFSNRAGSNASSLGLYLAQETYTFRGKAGRSYSSVGLRMRGESGEFNSAARSRGVVAHGAPYVSSREAGRSEGCPAMELWRANKLLPLIANGGVVFIYSPRDTRWLQQDPWING